MIADSLYKIAKLTRSHGLGGAFKVEPYNDHFEEIVASAPLTVCDRNGENSRAVKLDYLKFTKHQKIVKFKESNDRSESELFVKGHLLAPRHALPTLTESEYYIDDLIGLRVVDLDGKQLGVIKDVINYPAQDVYVIETDQGDKMVPAVGAIVREIEINKNVIRIENIPGLLD